MMMNKNLNLNGMMDVKFFLPELTKYHIPSLLPFYPISSVISIYFSTSFSHYGKYN